MKSQIDALFNGTHNNPFSFLGAHYHNQELIIRGLFPNAKKVELLVNQHALAELHQTDKRGLFAIQITESKSASELQSLFKNKEENQFSYQFKVHWENAVEILEDPYRFHLRLDDTQRWLLGEGSFIRPYEVLGAHFSECDGVSGVVFRVWAPNAQRVSVVGDFNAWDGRRNPMRFHASIGIWELFIPNLKAGQLYKYEIRNAKNEIILKADPFAFSSQLRPETASKISALPDYIPMTENRKKANQFNQPISIYEIHLGSWRRNGENHFWLNYDELARELIPYIQEMGFTHIELLPISEFPFDGSWGYQPLGLYSPTSRFGDPEGLRRFIKSAHDAGINVLLDWVPAHFPSDIHGLAQFDGTALYEHADPREGYHQDWNTLIYNFGRNEVRNYLVGNALYWIERFGFDGIRVDAVASMIYRDYSRQEGQWIPNQFGGRENLEALEFLKNMNGLIGREMDGAISIAEESTAFPAVTQPPENNGLGFHYKWNMGWMHDTLDYLKLNPIYRQYHHQKMTFGMLYHYNENFVIPLSHDEVVHGKGSLLDKMSGDTWQKFATLRAYYGYMWAYPAKKLLFMGGEFAQGGEWNHQQSLDWHLLGQSGGGWHKGVQNTVRDLNHLYRASPALFELDFDPNGFEWLVVDDRQNSIFVFERRSASGEKIIVVSNFTPVPRYGYRFGIKEAGIYQEIFNSDAEIYCGTNIGNCGLEIKSQNISAHGKNHSLSVTVPPLATIYLKKTA